MTLSNLPDLLSFNQRTRATSSIKARLDVVSQEAVTGIRADITEASNGRVGEVHLLQKALDDISQENRINALASNRVNLITQGISGARESLNGIDTRAFLTLNTGDQTAITSISDEANANLKNAMSSLSIRHGTRNLFSGDATNVPPYADTDTLIADVQNILSNAATSQDAEAALDTYFNDPAGGFNTRIYQGGDGDAASIRLGDTNRIPMEVRGDSQAIKDTLRGLSVMAAATQSGLDMDSDKFKDIFSAGISSAAKGSTGLVTLESNMGVYAESIEKLNARNSAEQATITTAYQAIVSRDQFEAASELKQLEVALETSYLITSRLSNLSLVNFLR